MACQTPDPTGSSKLTENSLLTTCNICTKIINIFALADHQAICTHHHSPKLPEIWSCDICSVEIPAVQKEEHLHSRDHLILISVNANKLQTVEADDLMVFDDAVGSEAKKSFYCITCNAGFPQEVKSAHIDGSVCRTPPIDQWMRESELERWDYSDPEPELDPPMQHTDNEPPHATKLTFLCTTCSARFPISEQTRHLFSWTCPICQLTMHTHAKELHISTACHRGLGDWYCSTCDRTLKLAARNQHENSTLHLANVQQGIIDDLHTNREIMEVQQGVIDAVDATRGNPTAVVSKAVGARKEITFVCTFCNNATFPAKELAKHGPTWQCHECAETMHRYYKADHKASKHPDPVPQSVEHPDSSSPVTSPNPTAGSTSPPALPIAPTTRLVKIDSSVPRLQVPIILGTANVTLRPMPPSMAYKPDDRYRCPTCKIIMAVNKRASHEGGQKHLEAVRVAEAKREEKQRMMEIKESLEAHMWDAEQSDKMNAVAGGENDRVVEDGGDKSAGRQTVGKLPLPLLYCTICDIQVLDDIEAHTHGPQHQGAVLQAKSAVVETQVLQSGQPKPEEPIIPPTAACLNPTAPTVSDTGRRNVLTATNTHTGYLRFQGSIGSSEVMEERKLGHGDVTRIPEANILPSNLTGPQRSFNTADSIFRNTSAYHCVLCELTIPTNARHIHESSLPHIRAVAVATARPTWETEMFRCDTCKKALPVSVHPFHRAGPWTCWLCQVTVHMDWIGAHLVSDGHVAREEGYIEDEWKRARE